MTEAKVDEPGIQSGARRALRLMVLVAAVVATAGWAQETRLVATDGTDSGNCVADACLTINYALGQAVAGDTVEVGPGTYVEAAGSAQSSQTNAIIIYDDGITLISSDGAESTIIDAGGATNAILIGDDAFNPDTPTIHPHNVTVEGFTVENWASRGIVQRRGTGTVHIQNNIVLKDSGTTTNAISISGGTGSTITDNVIESTSLENATYSGSGISLWGSNETLVENNTISGSDFGVLVIARPDWVDSNDPSWHDAHDNIIRNNTISDVTQGVVLQANVHGTKIEGNGIIDNEDGGIVFQDVGTDYHPQNTVIRDNFIAYNSIGIKFLDADNDPGAVVIENNTFEGNQSNLLDSTGHIDWVYFEDNNQFNALVRLVATDGEDTGNCVDSACLTINYAIGQAVAGDTVEVGPGTYVEAAGTAQSSQTNAIIIYDDGITLISSDGAGSTIIDAGGATNAILIGDDAFNPDTPTIHPHNVTVEGFTVVNWASRGIIQRRGTGTVHFRDNIVLKDSGTATNAISISGGTGSTVTGNVIESTSLENDDYSGSGISLWGSNETLVENNTISGSDFGVLVIARPDWVDSNDPSWYDAHDNIIRNNTISDVTQGVVLQANVHGTLIEGNEIVDNEDGGIVFQDVGTDYHPQNTEIRDNFIAYNSIGIKFLDADNDPGAVVIEGNTFEGNQSNLLDSTGHIDWVYFEDNNQFNALVRLVATDGEDTGNCVDSACLTINYAIGQAVAGDTVEVGPGTYVEAAGTAQSSQTNAIIIYDDGITLISSDGAESTIIDADGSTNAILIGDDAFNPDTSTIHPHNVTVEGFTVKNWASRGIIQRRGTGTVHFRDNIVLKDSGTATNAISISGGTGSTVTGNVIESTSLENDDYSGSGISLWGSNETLVENNTISGSDFGVLVIARPDWVDSNDPSWYDAHDNIIRNNTISDVTQGVVLQANVYGTKIEGNEIVDNDDGGIVFQDVGTDYHPQNTEIRDNFIAYNSIGIKFRDADNDPGTVVIEDNSFVSNRHQLNLSYDDPDLLAQAVANNSFDVGLDLSVEPGLPDGLDAGSGWAGFTAHLSSYGDVPESVVLWLESAGIDNGAHIDGALIEYFDGNAWQAMGWGGANHWNINREGFFLGRDVDQVVGFPISSDHDEVIPLRVNWPTGNYAIDVTLESVDSGDGSGQPGERIWLDWSGAFNVVTGIDPVPQPRLHEGSTSVSDTAFNAPADGQAELMLNFVLDSNGLISGAAQDDLNNQSPGDGAQPGFGFGEVMSERPDDSVTHFVFEGFINASAWSGSGEVVSSGGHTGARFYPYVARRADENGNPDVNGDYWVPRTDNYGFTYYWYAGDPEQGGTLVAVESMELSVIDHSAPADLDQVYVDDDFVSESHGASVSFTLPDGSSVDAVIGLDAFPTLAAGINTVADGGTVYLASGDYLTGRLAIINDLALVGVGDKPVISPADDMLGNNAADAWVLVDEGVAFNLSNVIVDGQSSMVNHGLRSHGHTTIDSVDFRNIQNPSSNYAGMAVLSFGGHVAGGAGAGDYSAAHLEVSNSTFEQIGRIGILVKGSGSTATIANNVFVGKGSGDHLDYAVDVGAEAAATITGNTVSDSRGIASTDGSNSAGIIVTSFWGTSASTAFIEGNTFANNLRGISVGYNDEDANDVVIEDNSFTNNRYQVNVSYDDLDLIEDTLTANTFDRAIVVRENPIAVTTIFSRIQDAIDAADEGHSIVIAAGDYTTTDQVLVDKSLSIHAEDSEQRPVIIPDADVTGSNAADAWWLIEEGVELSLADLVFDGDEYFVHHALRNHGHTTIDSVSFRNIQGSLSGRPYQGIAVLSYGGVVTGGSGADSHGGSGLGESSLTISNSDFEQIGRVGVLVKGTKAIADLTGLTYTGKGSGDFLDYAFEAGAGAQLSVSQSTATDNLGVADTDGSTSAAVMATTYFGDGTSLDLQDNVFSGSSGAVVLGYNEADTTHLVARNNQIVGNNVGMLLLADSIVADAECNWWGHASGPGGDGTGLGDPVIGPVTFQPWNTQPDGQCDGIPADLSLDIVKGVDPALVENGFAHFTATLGNTGGAVPEKVVLWVEVDGIDDADVAGGATLEFYENGQWNSFGWAGQASWQLGRDAWFIGRDGSEVVGFEIPENFIWPIPIRVNWDEGEYPLMVTIESTDGTAGPGERVYLNVSSTIEVEHYAAPELGISPTSFDFGQVGEFDAAETTFTVTNQGSSGTEVELGSIDIAGTDSGAFHISGGSCSSGNVLVGGAGCDIEVSFVPGAQGTFADAELALLSDANDVAASLTGIGIEPDWFDHFDGAFDQPDWQFFAFDGSPTLYEPATTQIVDDYLQINDPAALYAGGYIPRSFGESRVATLTNADGTNAGASPDNQIDHGVLSHFDPVLMEGYGAYVRYELNYQALVLIKFDAANLNPALIDERVEIATSNDDDWSMDRMYVVELDVVDQGGEALIVARAFDADTGVLLGTVEASDSAPLAAGYAGVVAITNSTGVNGTFDTASAVSGFASADLSDALIDFGAVDAFADSAPRTIKVDNRGNAELLITELSIGGSDAGEFSLSNSTCDTPVAAGDSCSFEVVFTPDGTGPALAEVVVESNASTSPDVVLLEGEGAVVEATVTLSDLEHVYDGDPKSATVMTDPAGLNVVVTYEGQEMQPTDAGSYAVEASIDDPNYSGSASGMLVIAAASVELVFDDLVQVYDGSEKLATVMTVPPGVDLEVTYDGASAAPVDAGSYLVYAEVVDPNYQSVSDSAVFVIEPGQAEVLLTDLVQTYDGNPQEVTVTTDPGGLDVIVTYDGALDAPTEAGNYVVFASVAEANWSGSASGMLVIEPASASIELDNLDQVYTGDPRVVTATTDPAGLTVEISYDGLTEAPVDAGSYAVVATIVDANYVGSVSDTLVVSPAEAGITIGELEQTYDGEPKEVVVTTAPAGLDVVVIYDSSVAAPVDAGSYAVEATVIDGNYAGAETATLVVSQGSQTIDFPALADRTVDDSPFVISANADSGLAVIFSVVSGPASIDGDTVTLTGELGEVVIEASQAGDDNWLPADPVQQSFVITEGDGHTLEAVSATLISGQSGEPVDAADLPTVRVLDQHDNPVAGMAVSFEVTSGGGSVSGSAQVTDDQGLAQVGGWMLGNESAQTLIATAPGLDGSPVEFTAEVDAVIGLEVSITDNRDTIEPGERNTYVVVASNAGPNAAVDATVSVELPLHLVAETADWSCYAGLGATCTASGTGGIDDSVTLAGGSSVVYVLEADVDPRAHGQIEVQAILALDEDQATDSTTTTVINVADSIFQDRFEPTADNGFTVNAAHIQGHLLIGSGFRGGLPPRVLLGGRDSGGNDVFRVRAFERDDLSLVRIELRDGVGQWQQSDWLEMQPATQGVLGFEYDPAAGLLMLVGERTDSMIQSSSRSGVNVSSLYTGSDDQVEIVLE